MSTKTVAKEQTCEEFADHLDNHYFFSEMIDEAYWGRDFKAILFFGALVREAESRGVTLTDVRDWDFDSWFWNLYHSSEKGLS